MAHDTDAHVTTDHDTIRKWAESRDGKPAAVSETHSKGDPGILRILFSDEAEDDGLEPISWDAFFEKFEEKNLAFLYQDETKSEHGTSRFHKFVDRDQHK
ncbi:hypothetical protein [Caenispirillum salinarum]|uniref:hypothetical protein n=1 Tax=Caenispirillum salinarum TaxID=859058 RepID=UPI00384F53EF